MSFMFFCIFFFFSSRRRHTRYIGDWSSDVCSSDLHPAKIEEVDLKPAYLEAMCRFADLELITKAKFKFAIDSMHGSGRGLLARSEERRVGKECRCGW